MKIYIYLVAFVLLGCNDPFRDGELEGLREKKDELKDSLLELRKNRIRECQSRLFKSDSLLTITLKKSREFQLIHKQLLLVAALANEDKTSLFLKEKMEELISRELNIIRSLDSSQGTLQDQNASHPPR
jgi:hypothetical protein